MDRQEKETILDYYDKTEAQQNDLAPKKISLKLIMERNLKNLDFKTDQVNDDKVEIKANQLLKLTQIHLDRENIDEIDNLVEYLGDIRNLYLQHNLIRKIENLEFFKNLKFLVLSNNKIERVENLKQLNNLKFLDLSFNLIESFQTDEFPRCLTFLDLSGNKCVSNSEFWENFVSESQEHFSKLIQLNRVNVSEIQREKNHAINYDESLDDIMQRIVERSTNRQKNDKNSFEEKWLEKRNKLESIKLDFNEKLLQSVTK
ncbi:leucine-rich repeat-containing 46 [Brachionus plicatilis]|uniref:Leucine-rich repeat-containing 46 n=1 Tax=Brachionus plicatilis TaxID=10195 RepID=A0A3M7RHC9_BRAPC|nr:leucine-rich repeat-containing 46 [Brachionus plicatilis]